MYVKIKHFCWVLIRFFNFSKSNSPNNGSNDINLSEVYFFCKDGRILPALGQQTFAMIEIESPHSIRLHNATKELSSSMSNTLKTSGWLKGDNKETEGEKMLDYNVLEYSNHDSIEKEPANDQNNANISLPPLLPFQNERSSGELKRERLLREANIHLIIGKMFLAMNKQGLNVYATTQLSCSLTNGANRRQLLFRQSNVEYSQALCLNLSGIIFCVLESYWKLLLYW